MRNKNELIAYNRGYRIVNGVIISPEGKTLKGSKYGSGYSKFNVRDGNKFLRVRVHRLVAYQKYGDVIFNDEILVRHLDSNSSNNNENNIEIGTSHDNRMDMPENERRFFSKNASDKNRKLNDNEITELQTLYKKGYRMSYLMDKFNITSKGTYSNYLNKKF